MDSLRSQSGFTYRRGCNLHKQMFLILSFQVRTPRSRVATLMQLCPKATRISFTKYFTDGIVMHNKPREGTTFRALNTHQCMVVVFFFRQPELVSCIWTALMRTEACYMCQCVARPIHLEPFHSLRYPMQ